MKTVSMELHCKLIFYSILNCFNLAVVEFLPKFSESHTKRAGCHPKF